MPDRMEVIFCKRRLGTASGWDGDPGELVWFYDFKPEGEAALQLAKGCLTLNIESDTFIVEDEDTELTSGPLVSYLATLPRLP